MGADFLAAESSVFIVNDPVWRELVELWQVTVRQARAETTPIPDNSPFRNQALQTSAGPRQHPTPAKLRAASKTSTSASPGRRPIRTGAPSTFGQCWIRNGVTPVQPFTKQRRFTQEPLHNWRAFALPPRPHQLQSPRQRPAFRASPFVSRFFSTAVCHCRPCRYLISLPPMPFDVPSSCIWPPVAVFVFKFSQSFHTQSPIASGHTLALGNIRLHGLLTYGRL